MIVRKIAFSPYRRSLTSTRTLQHSAKRFLLITEGLPQGKVIPRKFDHPRPKYDPPSWFQCFRVLTAWFQLNYFPSFFLGLVFIASCNGAFSTPFPPDPHDLYK